MYQFRDPIHGFIEITEDEKCIIDNRIFGFSRALWTVNWIVIKWIIC